MRYRSDEFGDVRSSIIEITIEVISPQLEWYILHHRPNPVNGRFVSATATLLVRLGVCSFGPRKVCARCWIGDDDERRMGIVGCWIREILGMTRTDSR